VNIHTLCGSQRLAFVLFSIVALCILPRSVSASPYVLTFSADVDAAGFGLASSEPLVFQVSYDSSATPYPGSNSTYLLPFSLRVGGYKVSGVGAISLSLQPAFDSVDMGAAGYVPGDSFRGSINGSNVWIASLDIVDNVAPIDMLDSTSLPTSPEFIKDANIIGVDIENYNGTEKITETFGPDDYKLSISSIPEPTTLTLTFASLAVLILIRLLRYRRARLGPQLCRRSEV
jgi:hypothetical protein